MGFHGTYGSSWAAAVFLLYAAALCAWLCGREGMCALCRGWRAIPLRTRAAAILAAAYAGTKPGGGNPRGVLPREGNARTNAEDGVTVAAARVAEGWNGFAGTLLSPSYTVAPDHLCSHWRDRSASRRAPVSPSAPGTARLGSTSLFMNPTCSCRAGSA